MMSFSLWTGICSPVEYAHWAIQHSGPLDSCND
jgi:hypothetical protein